VKLGTETLKHIKEREEEQFRRRGREREIEIEREREREGREREMDRELKAEVSQVSQVLFSKGSDVSVKTTLPPNC
jgi:hypothetical protein